MDKKDIENIVYFIIAIIWFVFSTIKSQKNKAAKQKQIKKKKTPVFEEIIPETKKDKQNTAASVKSTDFYTSKRKKLGDITNEIPEEVLAAQQRKLERQKKQNQTTKINQGEPEFESTLLGKISNQYNDLQKMVIFTEILQKPKY
ncbi:MAG: hypothetical protein ACK4IK_03805 [Bacteroidia bacterium]